MVLGGLAVVMLGGAVTADTGFPAGSVRYRLIEGSWFVDDCTICGRPPILVPIEGTFVLVPEPSKSLFDSFRVENLRFVGGPDVFRYTGELAGTYIRGGLEPLVHEMRLTGSLGAGEVELRSGMQELTIAPPWIEIDLTQVSPDPQEFPLQVFSLHLVAVPWPDVWFSTEVGFTSFDKARGSISEGDLLCTDGRVIRRNADLTGRLGIQPIVPDVGLDAVLRPTEGADSGSGPCQVWFSIERDIFSETLGLLRAGDLLSDAGWVVLPYGDLIGPFEPMPPVPDFGLDAVSHDAGADGAGAAGRFWFSVEEDFFSERLGKTIGHGDLLCSDGTIYRTNADLMAGFEPIDPMPKDFGLDAVFVWPHGEVWFSVEESFTDAQLGHVGEGDLLSDRGRIVMRNLDLVRAFGPLEDLADFGLDALHVGPVRLPGDLDVDCDVQLDDFAVLAGWHLRDWCIECGGADLDWDGRVTLADALVLAEYWLTGAGKPRLEARWSGCDGAPQEPDDEPRFRVEVQGRYVYFEDRVPANCCAERMELVMDLEGRTIHLLELEIPDAPCDCICAYPVRALLGPFEPGAYTLEVRQQTDGGSYLVGTVELAIVAVP